MAARQTRTRTYAPRMAPDDRRRQLLDAALELVAERGYGAVTIEAVANRVGVTRPVVYSVFANVDELLLALLDRVEKRTMDQALLAIADEGDGPAALIRRSMERFLQSIHDGPDGWRVVLQAEDSAAPKEVRRRYRRDRERVTGLLADTLASSLGSRADSFDTGVLAEVIVTLAHRGGTLMLEDPERYPLERMLLMIDGMVASVSELATAGSV